MATNKSINSRKIDLQDGVRVDRLRTLRSAAESSWRAAASTSEGAYSPVAGPHSVTFVGGYVALAKLHDVDTALLIEDDPARIFQLRDGRGNTWYARSMGSPLWYAWRDRDDDEMAAYIYDDLDSRANMVPLASMRAARYVAHQLGELMQFMRPEKVMPRSDRRFMKRRCVQLIELQSDLLALRVSKSTEIERRMKEVGVYWPLVNREAWLNENHH